MPTVNLAWNAPTTNVDGSPLTDLAGYRVYRQLGSAPAVLLAAVGLVTTFADTTVPSVSQTVTYQVSGTDNKVPSNEGPKSNNATVVIDVNPPQAPSGLTAVLA